MNAWDNYLQEQRDELKRYEEQKANAPINADAQALAKIYIEQGKESCIAELKRIGTTKKLKDFEVAILSERVRNLLINNGIILKK